MVGTYARKAGIPAATGRRRLDLLIILGPRRPPADEDAYDKSLRDALVQARLLKGDSPRWLEPGEVIQRRPANGEQWGALIILEDFPDEDS